MSRLPLNLRYLRELFKQQKPSDPENKDLGYARFSRRTFLAGSASFAIGSPPLIRSLGSEVVEQGSTSAAGRAVITAELQGAIATFKVPHAARMPFFWDTAPYILSDLLDGTAAGLRDFLCFFGLCHRSRFCLDAVVVSILRAQDLLAIDLRFKNLSLATVNEKPSLVRSQQNDPPLNDNKTKATTCTLDSTQAYLIIEFPPQSIAEQAFLEHDNSTSGCGSVSL